MRNIIYSAISILFLIGAAGLHYYLPQVDVVRVVETEIKRVEIPQGNTEQITRDVYQVQTEFLNGRPSVYRNEDAFLYLKWNSADLQTRFSSFARSESIVAVRHYGWRLTFFSMFPNALSVWEVDEDYRHIPLGNLVILLFIVCGVAGGWWQIRKFRRARDLHRQQRAEEERATAEQAEQEANSQQKQENKASRDALDEFISGDEPTRKGPVGGSLDGKEG